MKVNDIFKGISQPLPDEFMECLIHDEHVKIERIVWRGHTSPDTGWYDQNTNEWVMVIKCRARLSFEA